LLTLTYMAKKMNDKQTEFEKLELIAKIQNDLEELQECFVDISEILTQEKKSPSSKENNIYYIAPYIFREFENVQDLPLPLDEVISIYLDWSEKLYVTAALNKGKYKNKAVNSHMNNLFKLVQTIQKVIPAPRQEE